MRDFAVVKALTLNQSRVGRLLTSVTVAMLVGGGPWAAAQEAELVSRLPAPAEFEVDFTRDVKPILEASCLRCHGPERPKSGFRLTNREEALEGGDEGVDIVPGDSANSPLIHYVARLVPDMEMPPDGRGDPLTPGQVGILRAWIDQGAPWEAGESGPSTLATVSPMIGFLGVSGDTDKFREQLWQREGWTGGLEDFELIRQLDRGGRFVADGSVVLDNYRIGLSLEKPDVGFVRGGWEQYRKFSDNTGGYYELLDPTAFNLDRELYLDVGRAWVEFGLTLPKWPEMVVGYDLYYRDGSRSTLQWGPVTQGGVARNIYPAFKDIDEKRHVIRFDLDYDVAGWLLENDFRAEFYDLTTHRENALTHDLDAGGATAFSEVQEGYNHFQGANAIRVEKQFKDWLFAGGGYLYSHLEGDASLNITSANPSSIPLSAPEWSSQGIDLERESHVFSLSGLLGPWEGLSLQLALQNEWSRQQGLGAADLGFRSPGGLFPNPVDNRSNLDRQVFDENAGLRFTKIPFTTLYAEVRLQQESLGLYEEQIGAFDQFLRDTDTRGDLFGYRVGFNTSPWRRVSLAASYHRFQHDTDYDHKVDQAAPGSGIGYSAFITARNLTSDDVDVKLTWRMRSWLKTSVGYKFRSTDYRTTTDPVSFPGFLDISPGGQVLAGQYDAHIGSLNAWLTPWRRFYLSGTLSYQNTRTDTFANGSASVASYVGDIWSVIASGTYVLSETMDLLFSYSLSTADFAQPNVQQGLPLGIEYTQHALQVGLKRKLSERATAALRYGFFHYEEPSSSGINNYSAHGIYATVSYQFR